MPQNATPLGKSAPGPLNMSDSCAKCIFADPLQMSHACQHFLNLLSNPHVFIIFGKVQNPLRVPRKTTSERPKIVRNHQFLTLLTWKCASRHNAVHFSNISTSKSGLRLQFLHFSLSNLRRATTAYTFSKYQCQKWSKPIVFLSILTWTRASRRNRAHFCNISTSKSAPALRCFHILTWKRASRHNRAQIFISHLPNARPEHSWKFRC